MPLVDTNYPTDGCDFVPYDSHMLWIVIVSFVSAFFLAFGVGANDVANSFGTSVGSRVLTLRQACILATIFEILGAVSLGYNVSQTIRTGMIHTEYFDGQKKLFMLGYLAALIGSSICNIVATLFGLPISGTHSIVGAIIGFTVVAKGTQAVKWDGLIKIVASWFLSPVASGIISLLIYLFIRYLIIAKVDSLTPGLIALPFFYSITVFVNVFSIIQGGPGFLSQMPLWASLLIAFGLGLAVFLGVFFWVVPHLRSKVEAILDQTNEGAKTNNGFTDIELKQRESEIANNNGLDVELNSGSKSPPEEEEGDDKPEVAVLFTALQILTACFGSFAHGANDVSNAIGPLVAVMLLFTDGTPTGDTPTWILLFGGACISIGLWLWGRKVIQTMGNDLTKITPSTGFTIEIGAAMTVLLASKIGLPVSTTHCKVGSVVAVGRAHKSSQGVNWRLFMNIGAAWVLTVPATAIFSGLAMFGLKYLCP